MRQRADGRWEARVRLGNGQRRSVFAKTQREALTKLRALHAEQDAGLRLDGRGQTVADYIKNWLDERDPRTPAAGVRKLRHTTWAGHESRLRTHAIPAIGSIPIGQLTPEHIRAMLTKISTSSLSPTTVAMVRDNLATILQRAVRDRVLPYNPVSAVDTITRAKAATYVLTADQARALIHAAAGDEYEALIVLALHTGLRSGEMFGLQWVDVDLDKAQLTVRQSLIRVTGEGLRPSAPKTAASSATIPLTATAVAALRAHRVRQIEQRLKAGTNWQETGYVFTTELGTPVSASNYMRRHFYPIAALAGIPTRRQADGTQGLRLHDLRHGCGTLLISAGVKPKLVQTILRHSRLSTTMDLYVHAYDEDLRGAVASLESALGS
ncbi:MAG TPA: tyrosine-type recombinase/integrase [Patescibacteria group bacterium]|nr:tyrosine-type recombinase/integrase [Patescibacteria group bacterium]